MVSKLVITWDDTTHCLSWARSGAVGAAGAKAFTQIAVTAYFLDGSMHSLPAQDIGQTGNACPN